MATFDFTHYRRVIERFLDREPTNDDKSGASIWCLGQSYSSKPPDPPPASIDTHELNVDGIQIVHSTPSTEQSRLSSDFAITDATSVTSYNQEAESKRSSATSSTEGDGGWPPAFLDDFESRLWLTYRSNFASIARPPSSSSDSNLSLSVRLRSRFLEDDGFTSDTGWGCMIRSGQSLLANALLILRKGRAWRRSHTDDERETLELFADEPQAPFSIHKFVEYGAASCGKKPGEWFGPSATARCIRALSQANRQTGLRVWVSQESAEVDVSELLRVTRAGSDTFQPTLVLLSTRLGLDRVTPVYWEGLKVALMLPQSVGIAGGRPSASHYFVGVQGSSMLYLDPHHTRPALLPDKETHQLSQAAIATCHTRRLRRLPIEQMDPSMLIGFLLRDEQDFQAWREAMSRVPGKTIVHFSLPAHPKHSAVGERSGAIDEVESIDDDDESLA